MAIWITNARRPFWQGADIPKFINGMDSPLYRQIVCPRREIRFGTRACGQKPQAVFAEIEFNGQGPQAKLKEIVMKRAALSLILLVIATVLPLTVHGQNTAGGDHGHGNHSHSQPGQSTHRSHHQLASEEERTLVEFPPELVIQTLANMRDHLAALQEINDALAHSDFDVAGQIAEKRLGISSLRSHGAHEVARYMPKGMQEAGTAMHRAASRFALEAQTASVTGDLKSALAALGEVMSACVGCHARYRLK
jgi:hypothetical protein